MGLGLVQPTGTCSYNNLNFLFAQNCVIFACFVAEAVSIFFVFIIFFPSEKLRLVAFDEKRDLFYFDEKRIENLGSVS